MITIEKRRTLQLSTTIAVSVLSIVLAFAISSVVLAIMGYEPLKVFSITFQKTFFQTKGILENIVMLIPLTLCALSVAFAAKCGMWNIGVEGQFFAGAIAATGIAQAFPGLPPYLLIPLMFVAGAVAAGLVCLIAALPRVFWGISEILTTILISNIVTFFVKFLVYDAWHDKGTVAAQTAEFVPAAKLPTLIPNSRIHVGLIIAAAVVVLVYYVLKYTVFGYEMRAVGENPSAARYSGINVRRYILLSMFVSGCLAGIAGMLEVSGIVFRLQPSISADYGFSAFVIAWVARLNVGAIIIIGYLFAGLIVAGFKMQMMGFPPSLTVLFKGLVLLLVLAGELLTFYRIGWTRRRRAAQGGAAHAPAEALSVDPSCKDEEE